MARLLLPLPTPVKQFYVLDWIIWHLPVIGPMHRNRDHSDAMATMAASLQRGESIEQAIDNASRLHVNQVLRQRLLNCTAALGRGEPLKTAMADSPLSPLIVGLCASGTRANDLHSTLLFLARHYRSQFSRSREVLHAFAAPIVAGSGGLLVLAMWAWLYEPMLVIMEKTELWTKLW
jgi:type II secretory pathway component PulF